MYAVITAKPIYLVSTKRVKVTNRIKSNLLLSFFSIKIIKKDKSINSGSVHILVNTNNIGYEKVKMVGNNIFPKEPFKYNSAILPDKNIVVKNNAELSKVIDKNISALKKEIMNINSGYKGGQFV